LRLCKLVEALRAQQFGRTQTDAQVLVDALAVEGGWPCPAA
jgi:hypothetical protein